ncbi:J domain-containing protein [Candidatus Dependentiae bacterium]|nr:MAG: J domain-containing protein [Candidatus Dependentiae bacterium]
MKKNLLIMIALLSMQVAIGQEGAPTAPQSSESAFREAYNKIKGLRKQKLPWAEKLKIFNKAVDWLEKSRDCLSGRGCSKKQAYLANFVLGTAVGLGKILVTIGFEVVDARLDWLNFIATELGYRYFVKEKVSLFRCLTFRGCSDQTKRYLMFNLGQSTGGIVAGALMSIFMPEKVKSYQEKQERVKEERKRKTEEWIRRRFGVSDEEKWRKEEEKWRKEYEEWKRRKRVVGIQVTFQLSDEVKGELGLSPEISTFEWYEILGFSRVPSRTEARSKYKKLARTYHPDKAPADKKTLYEEVFMAISNANEQIPEQIPVEETGKAGKRESPTSPSMADVD